MENEPNHRDLKYDLKKPCSDCPFLKSTPFHDGIFNSLPELVSSADRGLLVHSCHKTDRRADSEAGKRYRGPLQHCAGLLIMMAKDEEMLGRPQLSAWASKKWNPDKMDKKALVWDNLVEMILAYSAWGKKLLKDRRNKNGDVVTRNCFQGSGRQVQGDAGSEIILRSKETVVSEGSQ